MASCGDCALTIEAQRNLMELWHGPIFVMWLVGPGTFVLLHPSICVGWTEPSQESPNRLFASTLSIYLLHPPCHSFLTLARILIFLYLVNLYNLCLFLFCLILLFSLSSRLFLHLLLLQFACNHVNAVCTETHPHSQNNERWRAHAWRRAAFMKKCWNKCYYIPAFLDNM